MRKIILLIIAVFTLMSCIETNESQSDYEKLRVQNIKLKKHIRRLNDSIAKLKFPAPDRVLVINELVYTNKLDSAKIQISQLKKLFPNSREAKNIDEVILLIQRKEEEKKRESEEEAERLAAAALKATVKSSSSSSSSNSNFSSSRSSSYSSTCGARTKKGGTCKRKVSGGGYCWQHS